MAEMSFSLRGAILLACAAGLIWGCGGEHAVSPSTSERDEASDQPLGKLAVDESATQAVVVATVFEDDAPLAGVAVALARSISGLAPKFSWADTTDAYGRARVDIDDAGGYYQVRATRGGNRIGTWASMPINGGQRVTVDLPIGGRRGRPARPSSRPH